MNRAAMLARLANERFDVLIVGGGATGLGCAVDAASRGYRTALIEAGDFAGGTSSRSTKLVHGGIRYLAQGNVHLVREALRERTRLRHNAPTLVHDLAFLIPAYRWYEPAYFLSGLRLYDRLAGRAAGFAQSRYLSRTAAQLRLPWLRRSTLRAAVEYHDGQFDDARLAIALARTAADRGAAIANYARCIRIQRGAAGVRDQETGSEFEVRTRVVVNAGGVFVDALRRLDDPASRTLLSLSRGSHIVLAPGTLPGSDALVVPRTVDGRVIFAIPWLGHTLVGTTDVPAAEAALDPQPTHAEITYLLATLNSYTEAPVDASAITATFAGLRPLVQRGGGLPTAKLSREHVVEVSPDGLVTVAGGKWTTYRTMSADAIDAAVAPAGLPYAPCITHDLRLHDDSRNEVRTLVAQRPDLAEPLHASFPYTKADVVNAFANEMARTVDDVLARRTRIAYLDASAATACHATVAGLRTLP